MIAKPDTDPMAFLRPSIFLTARASVIARDADAAISKPITPHVHQSAAEGRVVGGSRAGKVGAKLLGGSAGARPAKL